MSHFDRHANLWTMWGYPEDPDWDGETFDIGYTTDSGTGAVIASGLTKEDASLILDAVRAYVAADGAKERKPA